MTCLSIFRSTDSNYHQKRERLHDLLVLEIMQRMKPFLVSGQNIRLIPENYDETFLSTRVVKFELNEDGYLFLPLDNFIEATIGQVAEVFDKTFYLVFLDCDGKKITRIVNKKFCILPGEQKLGPFSPKRK